VKFKALSKELLYETFTNLGWTVTENHRNEIRIDGKAITLLLNEGVADLPVREQNNLNKLKQAYSKTVVEKIAKKKKWIIRNQSENKMTARRY
jgi:hypothetical protein|tara:strand:- start:348 stop:626 length:279 start_codon:yes stop_codon:yes gene_type:complete